MRKLAIIFIIVIFGILFATAYWPASTPAPKPEPALEEQPLFAPPTSEINPNQEAADLLEAEDLLITLHPEKALVIIKKYEHKINEGGNTADQWLDLMITASEQLKNTAQLEILYTYFPHAFKNNESAALLVANSYISLHKSEDYQRLRNRWSGRETRKDEWFVLDADQLLLDGKEQEAVLFLKSQSFPGKADTGRLVRLALLTAKENPKEAWSYLAEAQGKNPNSSEIRSYRGKLLETAGKKALALSEYLAAVELAPHNIFLREQLADFYVRHQQYPQALKIWQDNLTSSHLDIFWKKALFWGKMTKPTDIKWKTMTPPTGPSQPYVEYLISLNYGEFWNKDNFDKLPKSTHYLQTDQTTFWLRLLSALSQFNEDEAWDLLQYNPYTSVSWNASLEHALKQALSYRKTGSLSYEVKASTRIRDVSIPDDLEQRPLFEQLNILAKISDRGEIPNGLKELLLSKEAFAALILSGGWTEAALQINPFSVIPQSLPDWFVYNLTQAINQNRGPEEALEFANKQKPTQVLSLLIGELLIANGEPDAGLKRLLPLTIDSSETGHRATWLASLIYIEKKKYDKATDLIALRPSLADDLIGKETLARIALLQGKTTIADRLYAALESDSAEAKSYLARKAFAERNWKRARSLTEELLKANPNNPLLRKNLQKIVEEQHKMPA